MHRLEHDTDASPAALFSGHALLYTIYRHHHGLSPDQAVRRIAGEFRRSPAGDARTEAPRPAA